MAQSQWSFFCCLVLLVKESSCKTLDIWFDHQETFGIKGAETMEGYPTILDRVDYSRINWEDSLGHQGSYNFTDANWRKAKKGDGHIDKFLVYDSSEFVNGHRFDDDMLDVETDWDETDEDPWFAPGTEIHDVKRMGEQDYYNYLMGLVDEEHAREGDATRRRQQQQQRRHHYATGKKLKRRRSLPDEKATEEKEPPNEEEADKALVRKMEEVTEEEENERAEEVEEGGDEGVELTEEDKKRVERLLKIHGMKGEMEEEGEEEEEEEEEKMLEEEEEEEFTKPVKLKRRPCGSTSLRFCNPFFTVCVVSLCVLALVGVYCCLLFCYVVNPGGVCTTWCPCVYRCGHKYLRTQWTVEGMDGRPPEEGVINV